MKRLLSYCLIAGVFFTLGWYGQSYFDPEYSPASAGTDRSVANWPAMAGQRVPPPDQKPAAVAVESGQSALAHFRQLLRDSAFEQAVQLLADTRAISATEGRALQAALLTWLRTALAAGDTDGFMGLVDSHLALYYDDIDVLMLLAEFQSRQGYADESVRVLHMAYTYTYTPLQRQRVLDALASLVEHTDALYSRQERWGELLGFYQLLATIDLGEAAYGLRQAAIHLQLGDTNSATALLLPLESDPQLGGEARRLLQLLAGQSAVAPVVAEGLPLIRRGNHYLLEVELNGVSPVTLVLDTGASVSSLSSSRFSRLSRQSGFSLQGTQMFSTANGVVMAEVYRTDQLRIGEHLLRDVSLAVLDLPQEQGVDGLLGMNVLQNFRFEIDQDTAVLYLQAR